MPPAPVNTDPAPARPGRLKLSELALRTGAALEGDGNVAIARVASLDGAGPDAIAFLANPKYRDQLGRTNAGAVIVAPRMAGLTALPRLVSENPYATYARVASILYPVPAPVPGVHPLAAVDPGATVASSARIEAHVSIGAGALIGERVRIGAGTVIGAGVAVGDDSLLHPRVTIYDRCILGPRAIVHSGAVIGADGFGMAEDKGRWIKIPQVGRVVIGADVEIGANTTIDRGAIDDTVIEDDVKLDNQIQIGHNCRIGAHTAIAGCTGIAGSTHIGRNCKIGGAAMINGHIDIADGTVIMAGCGVDASIRTPGVFSSAIPAMPHREWLYMAAMIRHLRDIVTRIRTLERKAGVDAKEAPGPERTEGSASMDERLPPGEETVR